MMIRQPILLGNDTIHLREMISGKSTAVLLIHGLGVSGDYYVTFAKELSAYYDVYIIDLPGYGKTPQPKQPLTIKQLSDVVLEFVNSIEREDLIVFGQSMGCQIIAHAITEQPQKFTKAILLAPTANIQERTVIQQAIRLFQDTFREPISVNVIVFGNYVRMGIRRFLRTAHYMVNDYIEDTLANNSIPVLIVRGENDKIVPIDWVNFLATQTPNSRSAEMPHAPHLLQYKRPVALTKLCRDFIET